MKVVFICPPSPWLINDRDMEMLGYLYVAANVRKHGHEVQVADLSGLKEKDWYIPKGELYAITGTTPQEPYVKKIIQKLKKRQPRCRIVMGGVHATNCPERCLKLGADQVVVGEGEEVILEIINGRRDPIVRADFIQCLDDLPLPARDLVDSYSYQGLGTNSVIGDTPKMKESYIMTARGCPYNCAFCAQASMWKQKVREFSLDRVIREVTNVIDEYGVDRIYFEDDTLIINKSRVVKLCLALKELRKKKLFDWHCLGRASTTDEILYKLMVDCGCKQITYGIESFSDNLLKLMNKGTTGKMNYEAILTAKRAGLKVRGQLLVGFPGETWEDVKITAEYIKRSPADSYGVHIFIPFPGCDVWKNPDKYGVTIDTTTNFDNYHTIGKRGTHEVVVGDKDDIIKRKKYLLKAVGDRDIATSAERRSKDV